MLIGAACTATLAASAMGTSSSQASPSVYLPAQPLSAARAHPSYVFQVILQGSGTRGEAQVVSAVHARGASVARRLGTIPGASAAVPGSATSADVALDEP